jgi:hypothetical protein
MSRQAITNKAARVGRVPRKTLSDTSKSPAGWSALSVTALGRHLCRERTEESRTELVINVEARTSDAEVLSAILHSCRALMGAAVGANEMLGFTPASDQLAAMVIEFEKNGWAARAV